MIKGSDINLKIENQTGFEISDCQVFLNGLVANIGDLFSGDQQVIQIPEKLFKKSQGLPNPSYKNKIDPSKNRKESRSETDSNALYKSLLLNHENHILNSIHSKLQSSHNSLMLIGWIRAQVLPLEFLNKSITSRQLAFLQWKIPVENDDIF